MEEKNGEMIKIFGFVGLFISICLFVSSMGPAHEGGQLRALSQF